MLYKLTYVRTNGTVDYGLFQDTGRDDRCAATEALEYFRSKQDNVHLFAVLYQIPTEGKDRGKAFVLRQWCLAAKAGRTPFLVSANGEWGDPPPL